MSIYILHVTVMVDLREFSQKMFLEGLCFFFLLAVSTKMTSQGNCLGETLQAVLT